MAEAGFGPALRLSRPSTGPLSLSVNQGGGFVRTRPELDRANVQLYFSPVSYTRTPTRSPPADEPRPVRRLSP